MSSSETNLALTLIADSSILTGDIYRLVKITGNDIFGRSVLAVNSPVGVLGENPAGPDAAGQAQDPILQSLPVTLLVGRVKVKAGGNITAGQLLISDTAGRVLGVTDVASLAADVTAVGIALKGGAINEIIEMLAMPLTSSTET